MKTRLLPLGLVLGLASAARADYNPIPLTSGSFNADVVVEKTAPKPLRRSSTATVDQGTSNGADTWYETGYNTTNLTSGVPTAGATFTHQSDANYQFKMAPDYTTNNAILIDAAVTSATWTLSAPAAYAKLSFLSSGGNGGRTINVAVKHQDGSTETLSFTSPDWFGGGSPAWIANGRINVESCNFDNMNSGNPRLYSRDITLANTTSPVASLVLSDGGGTGGAHVGIFAVSGSTGGAFSPIDVAGYNQDMIVEVGAPYAGSLTNVTTVSMDGGTNNTGSTWYEQGYDPFNPTSGLPTAGSTVVSATLADHYYAMASSYTANNAVYVDTNQPTANLTLATRGAFTGLSFLSATANGVVTNQCLIQHADGSVETRTFLSRDWFNYSPFAYVANGRVDLGSKSLDMVSGNPRLYEAQFALDNTTSPVTNIVLTWLGAASVNGRVVVFAVSGTTGAVPAIIDPQPAPVLTYEGSNVQFTVSVTGTAPFSYQWQKGTNNVFVNLANGGNVAGANTATLSLGSVTLADAADYRVIVSNGGGPAQSAAASLTVISTMENMVGPGDTVTSFGGSSPDNESVIHAMDQNTSKYLNFGNGSTPPSAPMGLVVTPARGLTLISGLRFYTANDDENRDPANYILEGSNDGGSHYTLISSNALALPSGRNDGGHALDPLNQYEQQVMFANTNAFTSYRLSITRIKGNVSLMQVGEIEFLGVPVVSKRPIFTTQPLPQSIYDGQTAAFSGYANGDPAPSYFWIKGTNDVFVRLTDGGAVSGALTESLLLNPAQLADMADYALVAFNASGYTTSSIVTLTVISTNLVVTAPGDGVVSWGGPADALEAAVDGYTTNFVCRGHGPSAVAGFPPFTGPAGLILTPNAGPTVVVGMRLYTSTDTPARDPKDFKLEGSTDGVTFTTLASGALAMPAARNPSGYTIDPVYHSMREILFANTTAYTSYRISFNHVADENNANGVSAGEIQLLGQTLAPGATLAPTFANVAPGGSVTFTATLQNSDASSTLRWKKLVNGTFVALSDGGNLSGADTAALTLNNVTFADAGDYALTVGNPIGTLTSATAKLNVISAGQDVTATNDVVLRVNGTSPAAEAAAHAIDNLTDKYLNFGSGSNPEAVPFVGPVGLVVTPAAGATLVTGLRFYTASDVPQRDPADYTLEGANQGGAWTVISSGALTLPNDRNNGGLAADPAATVNQEVRFANAQAYSSYRLMFSHVKDSMMANSMQIGDVEFLGSAALQLSVTRGANGSITITTTQPGTLQSTTEFLGANTVWTSEGPITGSLTINPVAGQPVKFYRVLGQ